MNKSLKLIININTYRQLALLRTITSSTKNRAINLSISNKIHSPFFKNDLSNRWIHSTAYLEAKRLSMGKESKGKSKPKVQLTDEEMTEVIRVDVLKNQLDQSLNKLKENYSQHLSSRLASGTIEKIMVPVEGDEYPLNELAQILKKSPQLLVINMINFPEAIKAAMQAIQSSGVNASLQQDGTMIYMNLPKVTREFRETQAKKAKVLLNQTKEDMRNIQNKFIKDVRNKKDSFSEDLIFDIQENIKFMVEQRMLEGDKLLKSKEKELLGE